MILGKTDLTERCRGMVDGMDGASVSAGLAAGLLSYATGRGAVESELLGASGLRQSDLADPDARIPLANYVALTRAAETATGDAAISLHYAEDVGMSEVSIVGLIMEASATMGEAFLQLQRYGRLAAEFDEPGEAPHFILRQSEGGLFMEDRRQSASEFRQLREAAFVRLVCGPRRFLKEPHVLSVHFTHAAPSYSEEYDRIFQCPVHFDAPFNALELHPDIATWTVCRNPRYVFSLLTRHADALLSELDAARSWRGRTEKAILIRLHQGEISADRIAADLGFSRQTLFRKLKAEETSFAVILDDLRRRMAENYLAARRISVNETAYLLGFSDAASFSRAFKRWKGLSPTAFRDAQHISDA